MVRNEFQVCSGKRAAHREFGATYIGICKLTVVRVYDASGLVDSSKFPPLVDLRRYGTRSKFNKIIKSLRNILRYVPTYDLFCSMSYYSVDVT